MQDADGCTPLHLAVKNQQHATVELMLSFSSILTGSAGEGLSALRALPWLSRAPDASICDSKGWDAVKYMIFYSRWSPSLAAGSTEAVLIEKLVACGASLLGNDGDCENGGFGSNKRSLSDDAHDESNEQRLPCTHRTASSRCSAFAFAMEHDKIAFARLLSDAPFNVVIGRVRGSWLRRACADPHVPVDFIRRLITEGNAPVNEALRMPPVSQGLSASDVITIHEKSNHMREDASALLVSADAGRFDIAAMLLDEFDADASHADSLGNTVLHLSVATRRGSVRNHIAFIRSVIAKGGGSALVNAVNKQGHTALYLAFQNQQCDVACLLADEFHADASIGRDSGADMPLMCHVALCDESHISPEIIRLLVGKLGARLSHQSAVIIMLFLSWNRIAAVKVLFLEFGSLLNFGVLNMDVFEQLIVAGIGHLSDDSRNAASDVGNTWRPLVRAMVEDFGVDVNAKSTCGETALFVALREGMSNVERCHETVEHIVLLLIELGADAFHQRTSGRGFVAEKLPAVSIAMAYHKFFSVDTYRKLLKRPALVEEEGREDTAAARHCRRFYGQALVSACEEGALEVAKLLVHEFHADGAFVDSAGFTALHRLCKWKCSVCAPYETASRDSDTFARLAHLLASSADATANINAVDAAKRRTPLALLIGEACTRTPQCDEALIKRAKVLLTLGADANVTTPFAKDYGDTQREAIKDLVRMPLLHKLIDLRRPPLALIRMLVEIGGSPTEVCNHCETSAVAEAATKYHCLYEKEESGNEEEGEGALMRRIVRFLVSETERHDDAQNYWSESEEDTTDSDSD